MQPSILSYDDLFNFKDISLIQKLENALLQKGIVGIKGVPDFENKSRLFVEAARQFSSLSENIKLQYAPDRDSGDTHGYELGAEWFENQKGEWKIDDKKASFYAVVPNHFQNKWPLEVDLKTPYLELGELIFRTGQLLLQLIGLNESIGLHLQHLTGYGRMLHYHKENDLSNFNPNWCGAHFDHGVFTGLMPAYYFRDGQEVEEPDEAGLYIVPSDGDQFEKMDSKDKSVLLFQVGEFGQLISNDRIKATKHMVKKANGGIERFAFALFYSAADNTLIQSTSILAKDNRYIQNQSKTGLISYAAWEKSSYDRYRATIMANHSMKLIEGTL